MKFQAVRGTRDCYPDQMRLRNFIMEAWRRVSLRNGFEEYDSPIFEYLDLFTAKSGDEIASQLFSLTDRGGRNLAIRPEMTPALARMVNARVNALPQPIKWFSIGRCCRAERPQKGRTREFFQWNADVIGTNDVLADAECIFVCTDLLREVGLTSQDVKIHIGSRPLTIAALESVGINGSQADQVLPILDKRPKLTDETFRELMAGVGLDSKQIDAISQFQDCGSPDEVRQVLGELPNTDEPLATLGALLDRLAELGVSDYCRLDLRIVRGLAYYTGVVYEVFDTEHSLRAIGGGGRYDNLLEVLDGPQLGATGFGMGDVVLGIVLDEKGKLPQLSRRLDFFVIDGDDGQFSNVMNVVGRLRSGGLSADFSYTRRSIGKQLKEANKRGAKQAVIVRGDQVDIKDLSTGSQHNTSTSSFLGSLARN